MTNAAEEPKRWKVPASPLAIAWMVSYFAACAPATSALEQSLLDADMEFARASQSYGVDGWADAFAEDGFMVSRDGLIRGPDQIRSAMTDLFADSTLSFTWEPQEAYVDADGELGFTVGRYERRYGEGTEEVIDTGWYMTAWRQDQAGWVVLADIGSPDEPS